MRRWRRYLSRGLLLAACLLLAPTLLPQAAARMAGWMTPAGFHLALAALLLLACLLLLNRVILGLYQEFTSRE